MSKRNDSVVQELDSKEMAETQGGVDQISLNFTKIEFEYKPRAGGYGAASYQYANETTY